jgi:hypothetical protein
MVLATPGRAARLDHDGRSLAWCRRRFSVDGPGIPRLEGDEGVCASTIDTRAIPHDDLLGDVWPEEGSADDVIAADRRWRREGGAA